MEYKNPETAIKSHQEVYRGKIVTLHVDTIRQAWGGPQFVKLSCIRAESPQSRFSKTAVFFLSGNSDIQLENSYSSFQQENWIAANLPLRP